MKGRLDAPARVVSLNRVAGLDGIEEGPDGGLELGPLTRLSGLCAHPRVRVRWPALALASGQVGTPNLRNAATVAGDLLQRPRCWYFRKEAFLCARKGETPASRRRGRTPITRSS